MHVAAVLYQEGGVSDVGGAEEMGIKVQWPRQIMVDNAAAVSFQSGTNLDSRLGGTFDNREDWIQDMRDQQKVKGVKINTVYNMADLLTKCHGSAVFERLVSLVQGRHKDLTRREAWFK